MINKDKTVDNIFVDEIADTKAIINDVNSLLSSGSISTDDFDDSDLYGEMNGSDILLHHHIESVTPGTLVSMVSMITKSTPDVIYGPKGAILRVNMQYGSMIFMNEDLQASWTDDEAEESLLVGIVYKFTQGVYIDPRIQADLNRNLLAGRVVVNEHNELEYRSMLSFRGGRTVENALWDIVMFSKEAVCVKMALL